VTRREIVTLAAGLGAGSLYAQRSSANAGVARDLVYQALELLSANSMPQEITRALRFLRGALDQYPSFGDAHYYRALCLQRLNMDPQLQRSDMQAAEKYQSEALRDKRNPFVLAVPKIYENLAAVGQKWGLVVGISRFQPEIGAEPLNFAADDATAFHELLADPNAGRFPQNQLFLLKNESATTSAIKARLNTIATRAKPEDIVVFYISTHGSPRSDDLRGVSYLYTYDTDVTSRDQIFGTALAMVEISGIISTRCTAQRTLIIFDTCHSGAGIAYQALSSQDLDRLRMGAGRYVLSSCEENQRSYEDKGHGFFTASLIAQIRARQGCIRMNELYAAVSKEVSQKALQLYKKEQRPVLASSENAGELILGVPPGAASDSCIAKV
jgi:hypothetical protein